MPRKEKVEDRVAIAEAAGLRPAVMDVESYATQEAFGMIAPSLPANGRDQNVAFVDIGAHVTHFYVLRNNQFLFSRDQAFGGNQLTLDIQRAFNLSPEEAEAAKKNQGLPENYDNDVLQPFMETLALEITRAVVANAVPERQVLRPGRGADRIRLHEAKRFDGPDERGGSEKRSRDRVSPKVVQADDGRHRRVRDQRRRWRAARVA